MATAAKAQCDESQQETQNGPRSEGGGDLVEKTALSRTTEPWLHGLACAALSPCSHRLLCPQPPCAWLTPAHPEHVDLAGSAPCHTLTHCPSVACTSPPSTCCTGLHTGLSLSNPGAPRGQPRVVAVAQGLAGW